MRLSSEDEQIAARLGEGDENHGHRLPGNLCFGVCKWQRRWLAGHDCGQNSLAFNTGKQQLAPLLRAIVQAYFFAYPVAIEMIEQAGALAGHCFDQDRVAAADEKLVAEHMAASVEQEGFATVADRQFLNLVRRKIVQKAGAVIPDYFNPRAERKIDEPGPFGQCAKLGFQ